MTTQTRLWDRGHIYTMYMYKKNMWLGYPNIKGVRGECWSKWNSATCFSRLENVEKGQRSTTENIHKLWKAGERNLGHIVGEERTLPYWEKLRCFKTNTITRYWLKIKFLQLFNLVQEGSSFPHRHVVVKEIIREAIGCSNACTQSFIEWIKSPEPVLKRRGFQCEVSICPQITSSIIIS